MLPWDLWMSSSAPARSKVPVSAAKRRVAWWALIVAALCGCSFVVSDPGPENHPCGPGGACLTGYVCREGICVKGVGGDGGTDAGVEPDGGASDGGADGGPDGSIGEDGGLPDSGIHLLGIWASGVSASTDAGITLQGQFIWHAASGRVDGGIALEGAFQ